MTPYKYPKIAGCAILALIFLTCLPAAGQYSRTPKVRMTPRALAVLEFDAKGLGRLFPVMIMWEGKFYDASYYASKPVPLALYSETVYEGQKSGMPEGLFTVDGARRLVKLWWGEGTWKPFNSSKKANKKNDGKVATKDEAKVAAAKPTLKDDGDSERPVLKKPAAEAAPAPEAKREAEPKTATVAEPRSDDSDRPTLRRGKPVDTGKPTRDEPFEIVDPKKNGVISLPVETLVAISDPVPTDNRPLDMTLSPEEQDHLGKQMTQMAWTEVKKFAGSRVEIPANAVFTEVKLRAFDLDFNNNPLLVFSAEYKALVTKGNSEGVVPKQPTFYVTLVGKVDLEGRINKLYAATTDSLHLDAYSRLEFIDAVDADGDSRGELLFRQISDIDRKYVLYRATPYWSKMFEGASGQ